MLEKTFQSKLIKELKSLFPEAVVLKNDPNYIQGIPDILLLLPNGKWAALECKNRRGARRRPNQDYYINKLGKMGFARFIFPENKEEVLYELQQSL